VFLILYLGELIKINIMEGFMKKELYETPQIEIIEFELEDSIAASGDFGSNTFCGGEVGGTF
jgi:hypothetical protein